MIINAITTTLWAPINFAGLAKRESAARLDAELETLMRNVFVSPHVLNSAATMED